jgi:hypothetical protein
LDFCRVGVVHDAAELETQVSDVSIREGVLLELLDDGLKVGKGTYPR